MDSLMLIFAVLITLSPLVIHEYAHALVMRLYGIRLAGYGIGFGPTLFRIGRFGVKPVLLGAYVQPEPTDWASATPRARFWSVLAGPASNFAYAALLLGYAHLFGSPAMSMLATLSTAIGLVNLIPVPTLDGWQALTALLEMTGRALSPKAVRVSEIVGTAIVCAMPVLIFYA